MDFTAQLCWLWTGLCSIPPLAASHSVKHIKTGSFVTALSVTFHFYMSFVSTPLLPAASVPLKCLTLYLSWLGAGQVFKIACLVPLMFCYRSADVHWSMCLLLQEDRGKGRCLMVKYYRPPQQTCWHSLYSWKNSNTLMENIPLHVIHLQNILLQ